jgi:hypothetical protein
MRRSSTETAPSTSQPSLVPLSTNQSRLVRHRTVKGVPQSLSSCSSESMIFHWLKSIFPLPSSMGREFESKPTETGCIGRIIRKSQFNVRKSIPIDIWGQQKETGWDWHNTGEVVSTSSAALEASTRIHNQLPSTAPIHGARAVLQVKLKWESFPSTYSVVNWCFAAAFRFA